MLNYNNMKTLSKLHGSISFFLFGGKSIGMVTNNFGI